MKAEFERFTVRGEALQQCAIGLLLSLGAIDPAANLLQEVARLSRCHGSDSPWWRRIPSIVAGKRLGGLAFLKKK